MFKTRLFFLVFSFQFHPPELFTAVTKNLKLSAYHDSLIDHIVVFVEVRKKCSINNSGSGNPAGVTVVLLEKLLQFNVLSNFQVFCFWEHVSVSNS